MFDRIRNCIIPAIAFAGTLAATSTMAGAALPSTKAGAFDPTFNAGAVLFRPMATYFDFAMAVAIQADGKILMSGYGSNKSSDQTSSFITRQLADGSLDPTYATGGTLRLGSAESGRAGISMVVDPTGKALIAGSATLDDPANPNYRGWLTRVNVDGSVDADFGNQGEALPGCAPRSQCYYNGLAVQTDGRFVAFGAAYDPPYDKLTPVLDRFNADGSPDPTFGADGRVVLPDAVQGMEPYAVVVDASGRFLLSGRVSHPSPGVNEGLLVRLAPDGSLDPGFASGGVLRISVANLATDLRGFAIQADGKIVAAASTYDPKTSTPPYFGRVLRFNSDGTLDNSFGVQGVATLGGGYGNGIKLQKDGGIVFFGQGYIPDNYVPMTARLTAEGHLDTTFGDSGMVIAYPQGRISSLTAMEIGEDNRLTFAGYSEQQGVSARHSLLVRLIGTETTTNVIEFYNSALNHYFITADPNEAAAIDAGAAGPGWSRTGVAWKSGGPSRVCRFYGSPDINPATGKRLGPNGHFYTISEEECATVKQDAGWKFESYDFSGWQRQADGHCMAGTVAVKRAYNNRFAENDSNHRYTTSDAIYAQMLAAGWSGEGTVFCAPL